MNRAIKFRGKNYLNQEWVYGNGYVKDYFNDNEFIAIVGDPIIQHMDMIRVDTKTVGQFTGLKDKNGKDVYEGDICLIDDIQFDEDELFKIEWDDEMATFTLSSESITVTFDVIYAKQLEIVYNIHDNPELLKE